jgi:hypothetical protein
MPQGPIATLLNVLNPSKQSTPAKGDPSGNLRVANLGGANSALYLQAGTVVKASAGAVVRVVVQVAGSATGSINDCTATAAAVTANQIAVIPETVGPVTLEFPCLNGITVMPGSGQAVSVSYY